MTTEQTTATYVIPACNLPRFEREIAQLNKRTRRIGCSEITYETSHAFLEKEWERRPNGDSIWATDQPRNDYHETGCVREFLNLTVTGDSPKYAGYELVSVLEPIHLDEGSENIVRDLPGKESPKEYRVRVGECDHCKTIRRRKETFVVRHEDGSHKMVGRQCLADFLGHKNPHSLASLAEILASLTAICVGCQDEEWGGGRQEAESWSLESLLSLTIACMRKDGWMSRTAAKEAYEPVTATADNVLYLLTPPPAGSKAYKEWEKAAEERVPTDEQKEEATQAIEWVRDLTAEELERSDYLYNINLIGRAGFASRKLAGYACSIIVAYRKAMEREIERKRKAARPNEHVGQEGERLTLALRVEYQREIASDFGCSVLHKMVDSQGRSYSWFCSGEGYDPGQDVYVMGTVKRHSEFRGRKETQLTRVNEVQTERIEQQIADYKAKTKLTKPQQKKLARLEGELAARKEALEELANYAG